MGKIFLLILSNIMNNLDVAMCHLVDDYLVVTCQIKVGACYSCIVVVNIIIGTHMEYVYMVDIGVLYNGKVHPLFVTKN
jgi:hypothetical protein